MSTSVTTRDDPGGQSFEMDVDGAQAIAMYEIHGQTITFTHPKAPATLRGRGIGSQLVKAAL